MHKAFIIGNLVRDPEMRVIPSGANVCSFTVAVNRRTNGEQQADFYNVSAWRALGENCYKYLRKGSKCAVVGDLTLRQYQKKDGGQGASLEVNADAVEFLTSVQGQQGAQGAPSEPSMTKVEYDDSLPF